jgi:hypothetical protein
MKTIFFPLIFISMLLFYMPVQAAPESISKQQAMNIATQSHAGRVLAVKLKGNVYQVKMLSDSGKVQVIRIDAKSGKINPGTQSGSQTDSKPGR